MLTKFEAVRKLSDLVSRIKYANASCPDEFAVELKQIEAEISIIEFELELIIDNLMSNRYERYNQANANLRNPSGRWNTGRYDKERSK